MTHEIAELELLIDLHKHTVRQGPGSDEDTLNALDLINLPKDQPLTIADLGCGTGGPTMTLAQHTHGHITAVDLSVEFLEVLDSRARASGLENSIRTLHCAMDDLPFEQDTLDIIWSEGAIYNIGFEYGIKLWKDYLKPGGYLALSEVTWISQSRPKPLQEFWAKAYPDIDLASNKIRVLEDNGYTLAGYFILPQSSWTDHYYKPLEAGFEAFLARHNNSDLARKVIEEHVEEIELYRTYEDYYSYGFYIAVKK